jgi:dipeptidase E
MTLLLTSAGMQVKDEILKILPKPAEQIKIAHIITASKPEKDTSYVAEDKADMVKMGFQVEDVDIEGKNEDQLRDLLKDKDVIWVQGGNTFYLMKWVRESGFDKVIKELIDQGKIYVGVSAGSIIAGVNIAVAGFCGEVWDKNEVGLKDMTGMKFVDFAISPHLTDEELVILKKMQAEIDYKIRAITNDQAFLIKDGEVTLVGKGDEVII